MLALSCIFSFVCDHARLLILLRIRVRIAFAASIIIFISSPLHSCLLILRIPIRIAFSASIIFFISFPFAFLSAFSSHPHLLICFLLASSFTYPYLYTHLQSWSCSHLHWCILTCTLTWETSDQLKPDHAPLEPQPCLGHSSQPNKLRWDCSDDSFKSQVRVAVVRAYV